ncbi:MAG: hypothetical protein P8R54_26740 [Myxococcota bacterium]|nr:hypothetical protein [Myxococcota bacterium]
MKTLFEDTTALPFCLQDISAALSDIGRYFVETTRNMPDMTSVVLVEQGASFVTFKTNQGLVKRTNIAIEHTAERIRVEYAEEYWAGKLIAGISHVMDDFMPCPAGIAHCTTISGVEAPGFRGFFTRNLDVSGLGKALQVAQRRHIEARTR